MVQSELVIIDEAPLSIAERSELRECESVIEAGERVFVTVGNALLTVRDKRLYRDEHGSFESYLGIRWPNISRRRAYQLMDAATVVDNVNHGTQITADNERQIRPLTRLEPEDQALVWQRAVETAPNGRVTAAHVEQTVREWRADDQDVFTDPEADEYQELIEERKATPPMAVHFTSNTPEWYTPERIIDLVVEVFGQIDLDPCSNSDDPATANVPARKRYTAQIDGLAQQWFGKVYMNPPYGDEIGPWIEKLVSEYKSGRVTEAIALVPARTDTAWIQPLYDYYLCFVRGRLKFVGAENSAPFPSLIVYLGPDNDLFMDCFEQLGRTGRLQ